MLSPLHSRLCGVNWFLLQHTHPNVSTKLSNQNLRAILYHVHKVYLIKFGTNVSHVKGDGGKCPISGVIITSIKAQKLRGSQRYQYFLIIFYLIITVTINKMQIKYTHGPFAKIVIECLIMCPKRTFVSTQFHFDVQIMLIL